MIWVEWAAEELLEELPHRQVVFTIPKRLRPYFRYERTLLGDLAGCAWRALRLWMLAYFEDETVVPGAVGFVQTAGGHGLATIVPTSPLPLTRGLS